MSAKSGLPDIPQRISVACACGKKLLANSTQNGKRLKCPSSGQAVVVAPAWAGIVPISTRTVPQPHRRSGKLLLMVLLWSLPVFVAIGGGVVLHFDAKWRQQAKTNAANAEVREAINGAEDWLQQGSAKESEHAEQRLTKALAANDVSVMGNADGTLAAVRTRRAELVADSRFDTAKTKLDAKAIGEALALLHQYVADRHATKKPAAQQLLADYDLATSDAAALKTLVAMSETRFTQFKMMGILDDRPLAHPLLDEIRETTLRRNLEIGTQRREEHKIAEAKRQQAESEAHAAALRAAKDKSNVAGVWRHQAGKSEPFEVSLYPNGKIENPESESSWTFTGRTLVLRWANPSAPGGFWIDTVAVSDDGRTYRGANQQKTPIAGWKVDRPLVPAAIAMEKANATKQQRAELIRSSLVGVWSWAKEDNDLASRIKFAADGTYLEGRNRWVKSGSWGHWEPMGGRWRVEDDGTIWLSGSGPHEVMTVRLNLNDDKLSIAYTYPNRSEAYNVSVLASRFGSKKPKLVTKADIAGVWVHTPGTDEMSVTSQEMTLLPDGKIGDSASRNTWTLAGQTLVLRWADRHAPGGFWVETCNVWWGPKGERIHYSGRNQKKMRIAGYRGNLPPWFAKRREELLEDQRHHAIVTQDIRKRRAEEEQREIDAAGRRASKIWNAPGPDMTDEINRLEKKKAEDRAQTERAINGGR